MSRCPCGPVRRRGCGDSAAASHLSPAQGKPVIPPSAAFVTIDRTRFCLFFPHRRARARPCARLNRCSGFWRRVGSDRIHDTSANLNAGRNSTERLLAAVTFRGVSVSARASGSGASHGAARSGMWRPCGRVSRLSASRLEADTFYSTAAAAAHAQTQSRAASSSL